jgi:putative endonuclease
MSREAMGRAAWALGHAAEAWVARALEGKGWRVLEANYEAAGGEVDLVVARGGVLRFVEVKARTHAIMHPEESVTASKRARLAGAARSWLVAREGDWDEVAFLVAVVDCTREPWSIRWLDDAFDAGGA